MPLINHKVNSPDAEILPALQAPRSKIIKFVAPETKARAKTLTLARGGTWDGETKGRNVGCFECGSYDMAVTAKPVVGVVLCCNSCGVRGKPLFEKAVAAGFDLGPGPDRRRRPDLSKLQPASEAALAGLKRAERRVLAFLSTQTRTRWPKGFNPLVRERRYV